MIKPQICVNFLLRTARNNTELKGMTNNVLHNYGAYNITELHKLTPDILPQFQETDLEQQPRLLSQSATNEHNTHTHTQPVNDPLSRTTRVGRYQKKHSPTHMNLVHQASFINFLLYQLQSIASSMFNLCT